jgi:cardiolipin synthase
MKVLGICIFLIVIWLILDFSLGRKRHLSRVSKRETPFLHSNFEIFTNGKELIHDYFNSLRQAKKQIHVLFYIVKNDAISKEFLTILKEKALEGIEVRLLLDRLGCLKVKQAVVKDLRQAGVQVAFSAPVKLPFLFYSAQVRNHRKISVIDENIGYLGGFNIGKEYIDAGPPKLRPWRDYHVKISGEGVNELQKEFLLDWQHATSEDVFLSWPGPVGMAVHWEAAAELTFPLGRRMGVSRHQFIATEANQLEKQFIELIRMAEKEIIIGTPYFIPSREILDELLAALKRGVRLLVVVPYYADHPLVQEASYRFFRRLLREGAVVYQYKNGFYHAKTFVVDDKVCDVGTANFDKRSLYLNKEINCYIYDSVFITRLKAVLEKDIQDSERLSLETLEKPNLLRTVKEAAAYCLSYFL